MNPKEQGVNAENIFHGEATSEVARLVYKESTPLFSKAISQNLEPGEYILADLGSHKGEFLQDLKANLTQYKFKTIAVDVNKDNLESNDADHKIISNIAEIDLADKSVDITIVRYALAWNSIEDQKKILREIERITRHIAVIQHQGANSEQPLGLQKASKELFG